MKGFIVINGNARFESDFIHSQRDRLLSSHHVKSSVRNWRKVLLITAAWRKDEFNEGHVKESLFSIGVPSKKSGGVEQNIQNLGLYHEFNRLKDMDQGLYALYHRKQEVIKKTKEFYARKNNEFLAILRDQVRMMKEIFPETSLAGILNYNVLHHSRDLTGFDERELFHHYCCQDLQDTMSKIIENDQLMLRICGEIEGYFRDRSRVDEHPVYIAMRDEFRNRILSANSIFLFGGHMPVLLNRLKFFDLRDAFREALCRGTNFYTVSAGSMALADKVIVYDDFGHAAEGGHGREFEFFDKGLGLVTKVAIFPHCMDRIQTDDPDNLSYLANRFSSGVCVGLNEKSFLLVETVQDPHSGSVSDRFVSIGKGDGVYVFDQSGRKLCRGYGEVVETFNS